MELDAHEISSHAKEESEEENINIPMIASIRWRDILKLDDFERF